MHSSNSYLVPLPHTHTHVYTHIYIVRELNLESASLYNWGHSLYSYSYLYSYTTHTHIHCHTYTATHSYATEPNPPLRHAIEYATEAEFRGALLPHQKSTPIPTTPTTPTTQHPISRIWRFQVIFSNVAKRIWFPLWNSLFALLEAEISNGIMRIIPFWGTVHQWARAMVLCA